MPHSPRTAVVTGAYGAIGTAIARGLVERGLAVVLVGRDRVQLDRTVASLRSSHADADVSGAAVDVSRRTQVADFAAHFDRPLHILVNNASTTPRRRETTPEGFERQFATNVLGYFWMMRYLEPALARGTPARIVNVTSYWAGDLDLEDLEFERRSYDNDTAYRQSKQAERMLTVAFAEALRPAGIAVNACHPGDVRSKLSAALGYGGHESPEEAADTPIWLATDPAVADRTGAYFARRQERACEFARDRRAIARLASICDTRS